MYAVVRTGGKQYRVQEGTAVRVERLPGEVGDVIELGDVLLMDAGEGLAIGAPTVAGARVMGTIAEQGRSKKVIVFKYKAKTRYRKKTGHRQQFTKVVVDDILMPGQQPRPKPVVEASSETSAAPEKKGRRKKTETAAPAPEAVDEVTANASVGDEAQDAVVEVAEKPAKASRKKAE